MKIDLNKKEELKKILEEKLKKVPANQRIQIDTDILEELLFETIVLSKEENIIIKCPVWSGDFLSKIDLSNLSFEDVAWSDLEFMYSHFEDTLYYRDDEEAEELLDNLMTALENYGNRKLNYSNTNAKIDFKKSAEYKIYEEIEIDDTNFSGTDLSNFDINSKYTLSNLNLTNTGFPIERILKEKELNNRKNLFSIDFSNIDLSSIEINANELVSIKETFELSQRCNLKNTGIKIIYKKYKYLLKEIEKKSLGKMISLGLLDGCYIDEHLISSKEELKNKKLKLKEEQLKKEKTLKKLFNNIDKQIEKHL